MEPVAYLKYLMTLILILALILACAWLLKRYAARGGLPGGRKFRARERVLSLDEALPLDARRRLLLIRRDGVRHLLLVGGPNDLLIETVPSTPLDSVLPGDDSLFAHHNISPDPAVQRGTAP